MERKIYKRNKFKGFSNIFFGGLLLYGQYRFFKGYLESPESYYKYWIFISIIFLLMGLIFIYNGIKRILKNPIELELNSQGLVDNVSRLNVGLIEWNSIKNVSIGKIHKIDHLVIQLQEDYPLYYNTNVNRNYYVKINEQFGKCIVIAKNELSEKIHLVFQEINHFRQQNHITENS